MKNPSQVKHKELARKIRQLRADAKFRRYNEGVRGSQKRELGKLVSRIVDEASESGTLHSSGGTIRLPLQYKKDLSDFETETVTQYCEENGWIAKYEGSERGEFGYEHYFNLQSME